MPASSASAAKTAISSAIDAAATGRSFEGILRQLATDVRSRAEAAGSKAPSSRAVDPPNSQAVERLLFLAILGNAIRKTSDIAGFDVESNILTLMLRLHELRRSKEDAETARLELNEEEQQAILRNLSKASAAWKKILEAVLAIGR